MRESMERRTFSRLVRRFPRKTLLRIAVDCTFITIYLVQSWIVTINYLKFDVATMVHMNYPKEFLSPAFAICTSYTDVIDLERGKRLNRNLTKFSQPLRLVEAEQVQDMLTVGEIFDLTPKFTDGKSSRRGSLLTRCRVRNASNYDIPSYDHRQCLNMFSTRRFIAQESICYDFQLNSQVKNDYYDLYRLSQSLTHSGLFFKFIFSAKRSHLYWASKMRIIAHSHNILPFLSYSLAPVVWRRSEKGSEVNKFIVTYSMVKVFLLPKPYVTACDERVSRIDCYRNCLHKLTLEKFNKLSFSVLLAESEVDDGSVSRDRGILSSKDLNRDKVEEEVTNIASYCRLKCHETYCHRDYTMTQTLSFKSLADEFIKVEVGSMSQPFIIVSALPAVKWNDYILLMLSLVNFWLGYGVRDTLEPIFMFITRFPCRKSTAVADQLKANEDKLGYTLFCIESRCKSLRKVQYLYQAVQSELKK